MAEGDRSKIGFVFWIAQLGLLLVVFSVMHLGVIAQETLFNLVIIAVLGVMLALIAVTVRGGQFAPAPPSLKTVAATIAGFVILLLVNLGIWYFFDAPLFSSIGSEAWSERLLVNILAAICEEDLFFGVYCVAKAANLPDVWILFLSTVVFWALHGLVLNIHSFEVVVFLTAGRLVLTGLYAVTDHSDPSYVVHILWNVLNS